MAMNGLDKITEKIHAQALEASDRILADAKKECDRILADYATRTDEMRETLSLGAEREATDMIARAKAEAEANKRSALMDAKSRAVDEVFAGAYAEIKELDREKYAEMMVELLSAALTEQVGAEKVSRELYGEEEALAPERYEVIFNAGDSSRIGKDVVEKTVKKLSGKLPSAALDKLVLSEKTAAIDGGLILRCGDVESNCALSLLFAQLRRELETDVSRALFSPAKRI